MHTRDDAHAETAPEDDRSGMPLADVRVIEMGQLLAGPFCAQLLGDFGAAACLPEGPARRMLQRMEALAFGHLLGELLAHADDGAGAGLLQPLAALQARCLAAPEERPTFGAMAGALALSRPRRNAAST